MKLTKNLLLTLACVGTFISLILPNQAYNLVVSQTNQISPKLQSPKLTSPTLQPTEIDDWKIRDKAKLITVRVFSQDNTASGVLIGRQNTKAGEQSIYLYLVITNDHVVSDAKLDYHIETPDGRIHKAFFHPKSKIRFGDSVDLTLLYFYSPIRYEKAVIGDVFQIKNEETVFLGGFACQGRFCEKETEFLFQSGKALLLDKPLVKGYQLGFTSDTRPGTSGGVILNKKGELIAINGRGRFPLGNGQYKYADGTIPPQEWQNYMRYFAWGIPINLYKTLAPEAPFVGLTPPVQLTKEPYYVSEQQDTPKSRDFFPDIKSLLWACFIIVSSGFLGYLIWIILENTSRKKIVEYFSEVEEEQCKRYNRLKKIQRGFQKDYAAKMDKFRQKKLELEDTQHSLNILLENLQVELNQQDNIVEKFKHEESAQIEIVEKNISVEWQKLSNLYINKVNKEEFSCEITEIKKELNRKDILLKQLKIKLQNINTKYEKIRQEILALIHEQSQNEYHNKLQNLKVEFSKHDIRIENFKEQKSEVQNLHNNIHIKLKDLQVELYKRSTKIKELENIKDGIEKLRQNYHTQLKNIEEEFDLDSNQIKEFEDDINQVEKLQKKYQVQLEDIRKKFHKYIDQAKEFEGNIDLVKGVQKNINNQSKNLQEELLNNENLKQ